MKTIKPLLLEDLKTSHQMEKDFSRTRLSKSCMYFFTTTAMSLCLSDECKDYGNSCHSDAVLCSLRNCWSDSGCHHSDIKNDIVLRNDLSYVCLNCQIKKGNGFNNCMFSVHDQVEINDDTRDNVETALDLCVACSYYNL